MADEVTSFEANVRGVTDLVESGTNKVRSGVGLNPEGETGDRLDVLDLPQTDAELLKLRDEWERQYAPYEGKMTPIFARNLLSYLGRKADNSMPTETDVHAANLQFESEETFLPAATAQDPSPFVYADNTEEGNAISTTVQTMLQFHSQQLLLRRRLARMTRQWSIYHLGVLKFGWNKYEVGGKEFGDISIDNRKVQDFVFDPNGFVDVYGDFSSWMGERIYVTADKLIDLFPKHEEYIKGIVQGKLGTECCYTEWWNDDYCFVSFKEKILDKHKNEFFNYPDKMEGDFETEDGQPLMTQPRNHFSVPKKPYIFLSVYSLGERPHDITGLIEQNIPNQNMITRRTAQIDSNLTQNNTGLLLSENNFNQETGKQAVNALRRDVGFILVPAGGPITEAVQRSAPPALGAPYFDDLENSKNNLRSSWGTQGIASQQQKPDETARGMVLNQGRDTSRIGGGIVDILEQSVAKSCFDWFVQGYMVFYDVKHFAAVMGTGKAVEYATLQAQDIDRQLIVGVSPNSMQPKDQISEGNQAVSLFEAKAIGPKTLLETLNFANADDAAGDGVLYNLDPMAYLQMNFPEEYAKLQQIQAQAQAQAQQQQQAQMQQEQQAGQQQIQQKQAQGQAQMQQTEASHQQSLRHGEESHAQKLKQNEESASAKLASQASALPK
jgi:hypothetical protein